MDGVGVRFGLGLLLGVARLRGLCSSCSLILGGCRGWSLGSFRSNLGSFWYGD